MYTLKMFLEPRLKSSKCRKKERNGTNCLREIFFLF